jgi:hypothetical protein
MAVPGPAVPLMLTPAWRAPGSAPLFGLLPAPLASDSLQLTPPSVERATKACTTPPSAVSPGGSSGE